MTYFDDLREIPRGLSIALPRVDTVRRGTTKSRPSSYLKFNTPLREARQWQRIVNEVARQYDVDPTEILGKSRHREIVIPRMVAMARCRREITILGVPASYPEIGRWFRRDHTSVMNAVRKIPAP